MTRTRYITSASKKKKPSQKEKGLITVILVYHSFATRMKALGNIAMIMINETERLVDKHLSMIDKTLDNYEIIISVGHESYKVQQYIYKKYKNLNVRCVENTDYQNSNTCESIRLAINNTNNNKLLIINGSMLFETKLLQDMQMESLETIMSSDDVNKILDVGANVNEKTKLVEHISYGAIDKKWCEILYVSEENSLNEMRKSLESREFNNKVFYEFMNAMIQKNLKISYNTSSSKVLRIQNMGVSK